MNRTPDIIGRWRWPALAALAVIAAGAVIALLQPPPAAGVLDPNGTGATGGHALADLLTARGQHVLRTQVPERAAANRALELVTSPGLLSQTQLARAGRFNGDILVVDPDPRALRALAPAIRIADANIGTHVVRPACALREAEVAGDVYLGGAELDSASPAAHGCYPGMSGYGLMRYHDGARTISVLGTGTPLTNGYLGERGDAALAMNLLGNATEIVWLVPSPGNAPVASGSGSRPGTSSFFSLVPWPVYLIVIQLAIAVLLAAGWRARRLGPLVAERLPVIVPASETVEGHGRLYQSLRARDGAAAKLRAAARSGIARLTDAGTAARPDAIAARTGQTPAEVAGLLDGPPPKTDEALVALATELDTLMRKIRQS
jgi:hypothetical protein